MTGKKEGILAVDIGTSSTRATLITRGGRVLSRAEAQTPSRHGAEGRVTLDPDEAFSVVSGVVRGASDGYRPIAMGVTAQLGIVLTDADARPVAPTLLWADARARAQVGRIEALWSTLTGLRTGRTPTAEATAARLAWFAAFEPEALRRTACILSLKDWIVLQLTGEVVTDPVHAGYSLMFDVPSKTWSADAFRALDVDLTVAPPVREAHRQAGSITERAARATGLPAGIPVAVGGPDGTVGALGAGATQPGHSVDIAGSTDVLVHLVSEPILDDAKVVTTNAYLSGQLWTIGGATGLTGGAVDWLAALFGFSGAGDFVARFGAEAAAISAGADGLLFDTALGPHRFPYWHADRTSGFVGATTATGPAALLAAAREGAAFVVRDGLTALARVGAVPARLTIVGGLARDPQALQLRADVCELPVLGIGDGLATTRGAAALAATAAGVFPDIASAVCALKAEGRIFKPDAERSQQYRRVHEEWSAAFESAS